MIETGLVTLLTTAPSIAFICAGRVYADVRPNVPTYPLIEFKEISGKEDPTFDTPGLQKDRYQFDCYGMSKQDAALLRDALRKTLDRYAGLLADGTLLQDAQIINKITSYSDDPRIYCCSLEFYLFYTYTN